MTANNISPQFREDDRFTVTLGEDINEYIQNFIESGDDYNFNSPQILCYSHGFLDYESKIFYTTYVHLICFTSEKACVEINDKCSTICTQNIMINFFQNVDITSVMVNRSSSLSHTLAGLPELISKYTPQGPGIHRYV